MMPLAAGQTTEGALGVIIGLILVMALALISQHGLSTKRGLPPWLGRLLTGHTEFLFLGVLLGPAFLGWFDEDLIHQMKPIVTVALGWVGLFFGIQWDLNKVKRFSWAQFTTSWIQSLFTFLVVTAAMMGLLIGLQNVGGSVSHGVDWREIFLWSGILGVIASVTAPMGVGWLIALRGARGPNTQTAQFMAASDGIISLLIFGLILCALRPSSIVEVEGLRALANFGITLALGTGLGFLAHHLLRGRWDQPDYLLWLMGLIVFSSGIAHAVGQSPLVMNFIMGAVFVNRSHHSERVTKSLGGAEAAIYMVFLILGGAMWTPGGGLALWLILPCLLVRLLGKVVGFAAARRVMRLPPPIRGDLGLALISQGGVAIAMVIDCLLLRPESALGAAVASIAIVTIVVNQVIAPTLAVRPLRLAGELKKDQ